MLARLWRRLWAWVTGWSYPVVTDLRADDWMSLEKFEAGAITSDKIASGAVRHQSPMPFDITRRA